MSVGWSLVDYNKTVMKGRSQSIPVLNVQRQMLQQTQKQSHPGFLPFLSERKLGKLITEKTPEPRKMSLKDINFKNFRQIYKKESMIAEAAYCKLIRNPKQSDLVSDRGWTQKLKLSSIQRHPTTKFARGCCAVIDSTVTHPKHKCQKMDEQLYKRIAVMQPQIRSQETDQLFKHYAAACQLNENIRREELTRPRKYLLQ